MAPSLKSIKLHSTSSDSSEFEMSSLEDPKFGQSLNSNDLRKISLGELSEKDK